MKHTPYYSFIIVLLLQLTTAMAQRPAHTGRLQPVLGVSESERIPHHAD